jgi:hypothetical protein
MPRSMLAFAFPSLVWLFLVGGAGACAKTSDNPPVVTAPVTSSVSQPAPASPPLGSTADASATADTGTSGDTATSLDADAGAATAFQACQGDSDCVAVPRVGCCHNGWKEAVNVAQKDAYAASFTCQTRPLCPMYIIRDTRIPRCDLNTHLCGMVQAHP